MVHGDFPLEVGMISLRAYAGELKQEPAKSAFADLRARSAKDRVTLVYAARDETHNHAVALKAGARQDSLKASAL